MQHWRDRQPLLCSRPVGGISCTVAVVAPAPLDDFEKETITIWAGVKLQVAAPLSILIIKDIESPQSCDELGLEPKFSSDLGKVALRDRQALKAVLGKSLGRGKDVIRRKRQMLH